MNRLSPVAIIGDIAGTAMACWFFHFTSLLFDLDAAVHTLTTSRAVDVGPTKRDLGESTPRSRPEAIRSKLAGEGPTKCGIGGLFANYPMALDDANKKLFVGCRLPARLVILGTPSGRIVTSLSTVGDTDDIFYDPGRHLVYVISGERTGPFVPGFNRLFVAVPHRGLRSVRVLVYEVKGD